MISRGTSSRYCTGAPFDMRFALPKASWHEFRLFVEAIAFSIIVPGAVWYWIPRDLLGLWPTTLLPASWAAWQFVALLPLTLGLAAYLKCLWEFVARGRGIPAPLDHPQLLVVSGLYEYVRNPMYVASLLVLLGQALFFQSPGCLMYTIGWFILVHFNVIWHEEPYLTRRFGESYEQYKSAVGRWIPGRRYSADRTRVIRHLSS